MERSIPITMITMNDEFEHAPSLPTAHCYCHCLLPLPLPLPTATATAKEEQKYEKPPGTGAKRNFLSKMFVKC
ncbi:MAG: hypothetical protein DYG98_12025 [Haliscomenobacteraceae bacterium CHB4]|nr:hypothetical protein [Haliscomenobacteraceae bacterium CHB4]